MTETSAERLGLGPCMEALEAVSEHPEQLLSVQEGLAAEFTQLTKGLYDLLKSDFALEEGSPLKELVIENFDEEQIWQQLELQNSAVLGHFKKVVGRTVKDEDLYLVEPSEDEVSEEGISEEDPELDTDSENEETPGRNHKTNGNKKPEKTHVEEFSDDNSDIDFDIGKQESQSKLRESKKTLRRTAEKSIVDDQFFKLSEMEAFLEAAEKDDRKDDDDEEGVDYFEDIESGYEEEEEEEEFQKGNAKKKMTASSRDLHYKDYFDPVEDVEEESHPREDKEQHSEEELLAEEDIEEEMVDDDEEMVEEDEEEAMEETEESKKAKEAFKRVTFDLSDDSEGEDIGDILGGNKKQQISEPNEPKSSFEKREEKITEKIQVMQNQMMEEKSWQLRGEVTAQKRPENSLLAETLLFDHASRMAPTVTEETTVQLEDIIKQRIKDQVWDDVVRKEKPKENAFEYKKRLTLDHDKSKLSLAEIYEQEYVKLNQEKKEEENPKHVEIQKMLDSLFLKLDALSNFHFTPKPPVPEIKVVLNVPAISMEEVAPVSVSDAALLAPEEVKEKNKAGDVKTSAEKTETDKKRERRKKKAMKKQKIKEREERQQLAQKQRAEKGKKYTKEDAAADLKKITKEGKATVLKDEGKDKALKSSQAFFSQLQDQVKLQIKGVKLAQKKQKANALSVQKLKL